MGGQDREPCMGDGQLETRLQVESQCVGMNGTGGVGRLG